jgi:hypothetical protein
MRRPYIREIITDSDSQYLRAESALEELSCSKSTVHSFFSVLYFGLHIIGDE